MTTGSEHTEELLAVAEAEIKRLNELIDNNERFYQADRRKMWLTLRDKFAIAALTGLLSCQDQSQMPLLPDQMAILCFGYAAALLAARESKEPPVVMAVRRDDNQEE